MNRGAFGVVFIIACFIVLLVDAGTQPTDSYSSSGSAKSLSFKVSEELSHHGRRHSKHHTKSRKLDLYDCSFEESDFEESDFEEERSRLRGKLRSNKVSLISTSEVDSVSSKPGSTLTPGVNLSEDKNATSLSELPQYSFGPPTYLGPHNSDIGNQSIVFQDSLNNNFLSCQIDCYSMVGSNNAILFDVSNVNSFRFYNYWASYNQGCYAADKVTPLQRQLIIDACQKFSNNTLVTNVQPLIQDQKSWTAVNGLNTFKHKNIALPSAYHKGLKKRHDFDKHYENHGGVYYRVISGPGGVGGPGRGIGGPGRGVGGVGGPGKAVGGVGGPGKGVGVGGPGRAVGAVGGPGRGIGGPGRGVGGVGGPGKAVGVGGPGRAVGVGGPGKAVGGVAGRGVGVPGRAVGVGGPGKAVGVGGPGRAVGVGGPGRAVGVGGPGRAVGGPGRAVGAVGGPGRAVGVGVPGRAVGVGVPGKAVGVGGPGRAVGGVPGRAVGGVGGPGRAVGGVPGRGIGGPGKGGQ